MKAPRPAPCRPEDVFTFALVIGVLLLAFLSGGCAASAPPAPLWQDRVDVASAVYLHGGGAACSGVAIDDHIVATAAHCMQHAISEAIPSPGNAPRPVELVETYFADRDIALVRVGGAPLPLQARIATSNTLPGQLAFAAGFGCYGSLAIYPGIRTDLPDADGQDVYAMAICPGDSGGPVFNDRGELVGVLSARAVGNPLAYVEPL